MCVYPHMTYMPPILTRADSLREYLSGAASDGAAQASQALSLGNFRGSTEAVSLGIQIANAIPGVTVSYARGANPVGAGILTAIDANNITWQPQGATAAGPPTSFNGVGVSGIVEANGNAGQYLRLTVTTPLTPGMSTITLSYLYDNVFGMDDISIATAAAGGSEYRATIVRNEAAAAVQNFQRWLATLGTPQLTDGGGLPASGAGTIVTTGSFLDWPAAGWCQVRNTGGALKETVYYTSRSNTVLTVPATGRGLLSTAPIAGTALDGVYPTPGVAIAIDTAGVQAFGSSIQTVTNVTTAPASVSWNQEVTAATGLQIGTLLVNQQVGIWIWRQVPAGVISSPSVLTQLLDAFQAF